MNDRRAIARQAMAAALRTRLALGYGLDHAVCVYDLAEKLGLEVRFLDLPSMEGMYTSASDPTIIISSLRPPGRRAFTCAHELGHHNRGDGVQIDEFVEQWYKPRLAIPIEGEPTTEDSVSVQTLESVQTQEPSPPPTTPILITPPLRTTSAASPPSMGLSSGVGIE